MLLLLSPLEFHFRARGGHSAIARIADGIDRTVAVPSAGKSGRGWHGCPTGLLRFSASDRSLWVSGLMQNIADRLARVCPIMLTFLA